MRKLIIIGLVIGLALLALALREPFNIGEATIFLCLHSEAETVLERLGLPEDATDISDIRVEGPDGPMPEIATRSFVSGNTVDALQRFFHEKCKNEGLFHPGDDVLHLEPATICGGQKPSGIFDVLLFPKCSDNSCLVSIEVRYLMQ